MRNNLTSLRKKIDKVDKKIQKNLEKREKLIKKVRETKKKFKINIEDKSREKEVLGRIENKFVKRIYKEILSVSKEMQK